MVNEIIKTMGKQLGKKFPDCKIFADEVPQGFKVPCFQLECTEIKNSLYLGKRYKSENTFEVRYYGNGGRMDSNSVVMALFQLFSTLEMEDGPIMGTNMTMEKNDDNICFTVSYNCFFIYDEEKPIMDKYDFTIEEEVI